MSDDPLKQVLLRADAAAGSLAGSSAEVARQARRALQRQQVRKTRSLKVAAALLLVIGVAMGIGHFRMPPATKVAEAPRAPQRQGMDEVRLREEIADIRAQADAAQRSVAVMLETEERIRRPRDPVQRDPRDLIREQQDLAALTMVRQADRMYRELDRKQTATAAYERVLELFPKTTWATVARQRLADIKG